MFLESLLTHTPPWVDPRIITNELCNHAASQGNTMLHGRDILYSRMSQELRRVWMYSFGKENAAFVQEHPKEFLNMYAILSWLYSNHAIQSNNALIQNDWPRFFLNGCLRYLFEERASLKLYEAFQTIETQRNAVLSDLYNQLTNLKAKTAFQSWMRKQPGGDPVLQHCLMKELDHHSSYISAGVESTLSLAPYANLSLSKPLKNRLFQALLLDTLFSSRHVTPPVQEYFPEVLEQFNAWYSLLQSLDPDPAFQQSLQNEEMNGDEIHIGLSNKAYELLATLENHATTSATLEDFSEAPASASR